MSLATLTDYLAMFGRSAGLRAPAGHRVAQPERECNPGGENAPGRGQTS